MLKEVLMELFDRDLDKLITEINLYKEEDRLWITSEGISNSAGNLCLHLLGNLNHFIGAVLGKSGYVRHREEEFTIKNVPQRELVSRIGQLKQTVKKTLDGLRAPDLEKDYPLEMFGKTLKTGFFLTHLSTHLNYHLGQINYHRRLLG
jgi:uncharacterized damage-inducible protein DinB